MMTMEVVMVHRLLQYFALAKVAARAPALITASPTLTVTVTLTTTLTLTVTEAARAARSSYLALMPGRAITPTGWTRS
jgi:hypothetical protein